MFGIAFKTWVPRRARLIIIVLATLLCNSAVAGPRANSNANIQNGDLLLDWTADFGSAYGVGTSPFPSTLFTNTSDSFDFSVSGLVTAETAGGATADVDIRISGPASAIAGAQATYFILVINFGPSEATNIVINNTPPAGFTFASAPLDCASGFPCNLGSLPLNTGREIEVTFDINPAISGSVNNIVTVSSDLSDPVTGNDSASTTTQVAAEADLAVTKTGPANAVAGEQVTYTIEVTNNGSSTATNVVVDDTPPVGLTFASANAPCAGGFPCSLGTLTPSTGVAVDVIFDIDPAISGSVDNVATVSSDLTDPVPGNDSDSVTTQVAAEADLAVTKTGPANAVAGEQITYTIEVTNNGSSTATNIVVDDTPPTGLTFASATAPCAGGFPCNLGTLPPSTGVAIDVTFDIDPGATGTLDNTASVASDVSDPNSANDADSSSATIDMIADLSISKTDNETLISPKDSVTYTIVASNAGPSAVTDAVVIDNFQLPLTDCVWQTMGTGGGFAATSGVGDINEIIGLPPGATITFLAQCGTLFTSGPVINTATIDSASAADPNSLNNTAVDDDTRLVALRPVPALDYWSLWLLIGLIATIGLVRARNTA